MRKENVVQKKKLEALIAGKHVAEAAAAYEVLEQQVEDGAAHEVSLAPRHFPEDILNKFECYEWRHASAILKSDFPQECEDIFALLRAFELKKSWVVEAGKNKTNLAKWIDTFLGERGWVETQFDTAIVVDDKERKSPTHKVDCFKNGVAFELEWNNKDPFYDRDLNNFRLLFELRAVSVGVIFTRSTELQEIFDDLGKGASYGNSTTHMKKLLPRIAGGGGGGCPIIAIGIPQKAYREDL